MNSGKKKPSYSDLEKRIRELETLVENGNFLNDLKNQNDPEIVFQTSNSDRFEGKGRDDGFRNESKKPATEKFHLSMLDMRNGFAYCKMLYEGEVPVDFVYLIVNKSFEEHTGLKNVCGKRATEVIPGIKESTPEVFEIYGRVAKTGKSEQFEVFVDVMKGWFAVSVFRTSADHFIAVFDNITDRKKTEQALRYSEANLNAVFNATEESIVLISVKNQLLTLNNVAAEWMKRSSEELIGHKIDELLPPEIMEEFKPKIEAAIQTGKEIDLVSDHDGRWFSHHLYPIKELNGEINRLAIFGRDITDMTKAEEALKENEERFRDIIFSVGDWVWEIDENGTYIYTSPKGTEYFGSKPEDIIGKSPFDFMTPEDAERLLPVFSEIVENRLSIVDLENWNIRKDGSKICLLTNGIPFFDQDGKYKGYRGVDKDITNRKKAEKAFLESEKRYRLLAENATDVIWVYDLESSDFVYISPSVERLLGYSSEYVLEHGLGKIVTRDSLNYFNAVIPDRIKQFKKGKNEVYVDEIEHVHRNGSHIWIEINSQIKINPDNGRLELNGDLRDVTARKKAELQISLKNEELAELLAEKDRFFSIVAHDLRSPFNALLGFTQLLAEDVQFMPVSKISDISLVLRNSVVNLYGLLENLLDWTRIKRGKTTMESSVFSLEQEVKKSIKPIQNFAEKKGIKIFTALPGDIDLVADEYMFGSIIRNLVTNAVKFSPYGGSINLTARILNDEFVEISVSDTGIGMDEELVDRLFKTEEQTGRKGTDGESSTGLGLFLCKEFVEKHGGDIWVESQVGKGSTFHFTMPFD